MNNQPDQIAGIEVFSNPEDLAASMNTASETTTEAPVQQEEAVVEQPVEQPVIEQQPPQETLQYSKKKQFRLSHKRLNLQQIQNLSIQSKTSSRLCFLS